LGQIKIHYFGSGSSDPKVLEPEVRNFFSSQLKKTRLFTWPQTSMTPPPPRTAVASAGPKGKMFRYMNNFISKIVIFGKKKFVFLNSLKLFTF
jgi:hypothetical protein